MEWPCTTSPSPTEWTASSTAEVGDLGPVLGSGVKPTVAPLFLPRGRRMQGVEGSSLRAPETHLRPDVEHQPLDHIPGSAKGINRPPDWASRDRGARAVHPSSLERVTLVSLLCGDQFYESARPDGCWTRPLNLGPLGLPGPPVAVPPATHDPLGP